MKNQDQVEQKKNKAIMLLRLIFGLFYTVGLSWLFLFVLASSLMIWALIGVTYPSTIPTIKFMVDLTRVFLNCFILGLVGYFMLRKKKGGDNGSKKEN